jgi:hypothetical protein
MEGLETRSSFRKIKKYNSNTDTPALLKIILLTFVR